MPCKFFFTVIVFRKVVGGLKLGLYVFHHNNSFNLINIYSAKTITIEYKKIRIYRCFALQFFFYNFACVNFFYALLGLCNFFFTNSYNAVISRTVASVSQGAQILPPPPPLNLGLRP